MKKKKIHKAKEIFKIKNQIIRKIPRAKDIVIKVDKTEKGKFESLIKIHIPPKKNLLAIKKDESPKQALEKSKNAILKQINKVKQKRLSKNKKEYYDLSA